LYDAQRAGIAADGIFNERAALNNC